jgi:bacteriorhodopsin
LLVWAVNVVAFTNYASLLAGLQRPVLTASGGLMQPQRFLEWAFTTSFLIRLLGVLTPDGPRARSLVRRTVALNVIVIALGCAEQYSPQPLAWTLFAAASTLFVPVMAGQLALYRQGGETLSTPSDAAALASLRRSTLLTWCAFPMVRAACLRGMLDERWQEVIFTGLDVFSKFGFAAFLLVGTFDLMTPRALGASRGL